VKIAYFAAASALALAASTPAAAQHADHGGMTMPMPEQPTAAAEAPQPDATPMHAGHEMAMTGAFGPYPMARDSSGTAWQPDASDHGGLHAMSGDWTLMGHGLFNLVYDRQSSRRGR
jgi:hypothetical protein